MVNPHSSTYCMVLYYHYQKTVHSYNFSIKSYYQQMPALILLVHWNLNKYMPDFSLVTWCSTLKYSPNLEPQVGEWEHAGNGCGAVYPYCFPLPRSFPAEEVSSAVSVTVAQWDSLSRWLVPGRQWTPVVWHQSKQWATRRRAPLRDLI